MYRIFPLSTYLDGHHLKEIKLVSENLCNRQENANWVEKNFHNRTWKVNGMKILSDPRDLFSFRIQFIPRHDDILFEHPPPQYYSHIFSQLHDRFPSTKKECCCKQTALNVFFWKKDNKAWILWDTNPYRQIVLKIFQWPHFNDIKFVLKIS